MIRVKRFGEVGETVSSKEDTYARRGGCVAPVRGHPVNEDTKEGSMRKETVDVKGEEGKVVLGE